MEPADAFNPRISRIPHVSLRLPSIHFRVQSYRLDATHTAALSAVLTPGTSFIKSGDVAGRTLPATAAAVLCGLRR